MLEAVEVSIVLAVDGIAVHVEQVEVGTFDAVHVVQVEVGINDPVQVEQVEVGITFEAVQVEQVEEGIKLEHVVVTSVEDPLVEVTGLIFSVRATDVVDEEVIELDGAKFAELEEVELIILELVDGIELILLLVGTIELLDAVELVEIIEAADVELDGATEEELELDGLEAEGIIIFEFKVGRELDEEEEKLEDGAVELLERVVGVIELRTLDELETKELELVLEIEVEVEVEPGGVSTTTSAQLQNLSDLVSIDH